MKHIVSVFFAFALMACATAPEDLPTASVSTLQYDGHNCKQIAAEVARVERQVNELYYRLDKKASNDAAQMGVGLVLFWPTLFFLEGGDGPEAAEYSRLKGEMEALERVAIKKKCGIDFPEPPKRKEPSSQQRNNFQD